MCMCEWGCVRLSTKTMVHEKPDKARHVMNFSNPSNLVLTFFLRYKLYTKANKCGISFIQRVNEKKENTCKDVMIHSNTLDLLFKIKYY